MVNTGASGTTSSSSVLLHSQQSSKHPRQQSQGAALVHQTVTKSKVEKGSAKTTILQSSSAPILLSSTTSPSTNTTRPIPSLSPSTILELPVIFAKDGDPDQYMGAAALTAPLPVTISDEVAAMSGISMGQDNKTQPR